MVALPGLTQEMEAELRLNVVAPFRCGNDHFVDFDNAMDAHLSIVYQRGVKRLGQKGRIIALTWNE